MSTNMNLNNEITSLKEENSSLVKQVSDLENDVAELEEQLSILSQVYILTWDVEDVTTHAFQTEIGNFEISLYPNPSPGEVFISCTEMIEEVRVFNLQGQLLKQFDVNDYETSFTVNRSQMPVGTYLVHIKTAKGNSTHRMVFQ
jgi:predicted RNase H-like nuclease (RuvC/YqgF family)